MPFPSALDLVLSALEQIRENCKRAPCASRGAIDQLVARVSLRAVGSTESEASPRTHGQDARAMDTPRKIDIDNSELRKSSRAVSSHESKIDMLAAINARVAVCVKCPHLASSRTQTVFGVGNPDADLMFIGEAPGADEDVQGEPFVGRAGQLLTRIIKTMGFARADVYIANILKCRPDMPGGSSGNRPPTLTEMETCKPYLLEQIGIIQPKVVVALGATAVEGLLGSRGSMRDLRGRWHEYNGTPLMITYHPAYLLRNQSPSEKRKVWEDMLLVLERLERPITEKQRGYFR